MKSVTREEMTTFVNNFPYPLTFDRCCISDPPLCSWNDFALGNWPMSVVAKYHPEWSGMPEHGWQIVEWEP